MIIATYTESKKLSVSLAKFHMWEASICLLRIIAAILGVAFCFLPFLYEEKDRKLDALDVKVRDVLSEWWIKIDDAKKYNLSRHTMFMRVVAGLAASVFDRLFGRNLFSFQSIAVSACYGLASISLCTNFFLAIGFNTYSYKPNISKLIAFTVLFFVLGTFPMFSQKRWWRILWYLLLLIMPLIMSVAISVTGRIGARILTGNVGPGGSVAIRYAQLIYSILFSGLVINFACNAGFIVIPRKALRWSSGLDSFLKITGIILLNILLAVALISGPILIGMIFVEPGLGPITILSLIVAYSNTINFLAALIFIILAVIMLVHRVFYPVLARPIYFLQRAGLIRRKNLAFTIGIALLGFASGIEVPSLLKDILNDLAG